MLVLNTWHNKKKNKLKCRHVHYIVWLVSNVHIFEYILVTKHKSNIFIIHNINASSSSTFLQYHNELGTQALQCVWRIIRSIMYIVEHRVE